MVLGLLCVLTKKNMCPHLDGQWEGGGTSRGALGWRLGCWKGWKACPAELKM